MTKEELEKEVEEWVKDNHFIIDGGECSGLFESDETQKEAYLAGAEPREKRIAELEKENAELKKKLEEADNATDCSNKQEEIIAKAKEIIKIATEGIKYWGIVGGTERPFEKQAEKMFNLFLDKAEQFLKDCDIDNAIQQANKGLDFDKIADEIEQDLKDSEVEK